MDIKKKLHHYSNSNQQYTGVNHVNESKSKSVKTQTEESMYSICSAGERKKINSSNEDIKQCFNQNIWKTDSVSMCPVCSHSLIQQPYTQNANQLCQFPVSWYQPCSPYNNYMSMAPFISIPVIPNVLPYNMMNQHNHDLEIKMSGTSLNSKVHNLSQQTSNTSFSNGAESSNNNSCSKPTKGDNRLKTCIRSEPNVTKKDIELESIRLLNNTFNNNSKRNSFKSDPSIPSSAKVKVSSSNSSNKQNHDIGVKSNYLSNKNNDFKCVKDDSNSIFNPTSNEFFKSPIYKYADIRINELSSSLKDIKENIHKLSSKASELNICDTNISSDDNLKKYFKSIYTELRDKDKHVTSLSDMLAAKFAKMKAATANSSCNNNNDSNSVADEASLCSSQREVFDVYSNYQDKSNSERDKMSDTFDESNSIKHTVPRHDISNVLNQNYDNEDCSLQSIPVKIKSDMLSNNNTRTKIGNNGKISAHCNSPTFMSNLNNSKSNDEKSNDLTFKSGFNKPFVNISFNSNYDSCSDEENNSATSCTPRTNESNDKTNESFVLNKKNENHNINKYLNVRSNEFNNYNDMIEAIDSVCNDNNKNNINNDKDNEVSFPIRSQKSQKQQQQQPPPPPQQSTKHIESWLDKTVVEINSPQHSQQQYQQQQHSSGKRQLQHATLNNLEVLSKISEEEEETFSLSSTSESDEIDKSFDISKYCISNNIANNNNSNNNNNNSSNVSTSIRNMAIPNNYFINEKGFQDVSKLKTTDLDSRS